MFEVEVQIREGRTKRIWTRQVEECMKVGLSKEHVPVHQNGLLALAILPLG